MTTATKADLAERTATDVAPEPDAERARRYSDERMTGLARLACGIAHEVNSPLGAVQSNITTSASVVADLRTALEPLLRGHRGPSIDEVWGALRDLDEIARDAREGLSRISRIIGQLAAFGETDPGRLEEVSLAEEAARVADLFRPHPPSRPAVDIRLLGTAPSVVTNRAHVRQVFIDLLENAVRAAEHSEEVGRGPTVRVETSSDLRAVYTAVTDNGPGIPLEQRAHIFDPFFTTKAHWRSTGLGLTAAYGRVRALGGSIAVESAVGMGTTVTITLPLELRPAGHAAPRLRTGRYYEDVP